MPKSDITASKIRDFMNQTVQYLEYQASDYDQHRFDILLDSTTDCSHLLHMLSQQGLTPTLTPAERNDLSYALLFLSVALEEKVWAIARANRYEVPKEWSHTFVLMIKGASTTSNNYRLYKNTEMINA